MKDKKKARVTNVVYVPTHYSFKYLQDLLSFNTCTDRCHYWIEFKIKGICPNLPTENS